MREIKNYPDYFISETGIVTRKKDNKIVSVHLNHKGYPSVNLQNNNSWKVITIHRLVALTYIPVIADKPQVNHIDGNKENNHISNLEWVNNRENTLHAIKEKLYKCAVGSRHGMSKITEDIVLKIRADKRRLADISKEYNICISSVSKIRSGILWSHV